MEGRIVRASAVVFVASFCTLVIELVAGRVLAPWVGVSLYTWTSIIGVVLAGISGGAWAGGVLADRRGSPRVLALLLLLSGLAAFAIVPIADAIGSGRFLATVAGNSLMLRVVILAATLFFLPAFLLGMISPVVVKLALTDLTRSGNVVGRIYAFSTLGSILGTFATGFFLISWLGTRAVLISVGAVLIATAVIVVLSSPRQKLLATIAAAVLTTGCVYLFHDQVGPGEPGEYVVESDYYTIRVREMTRIDGGGKLQTLVLDHLAHSLNDLRDPCYLAYGYLRIFKEAVELNAAGDAPKFLFIGGGGYTLPRCFEQEWPRSQIDVVEIDPALTRIAREKLGLAADSRIRSFNEDARWFVMNSREKYDFIFCDAFNDLSIPYQLTTVEFVDRVDKLRTPNGVVLSNVIDNIPRGDFLPSLVRTMELVFGPEEVHLLVDRESFGFGIQTTVVVAAGGREFDGTTTAEIPKSVLDPSYARGRWLILTDDHAPVDNLLAPLFAERLRHRR